MTIRIDGTNTATNPGITGTDTDTGLQFGTDEVNIVTGGTTRATVDANGDFSVNTDALFVDASTDRVGIGVSTPADTLHVRGPVSGTILNLDRAGSYSWKFGQTSGSDLTFTGDTTERVRFASNGQVTMTQSAAGTTSLFNNATSGSFTGNVQVIRTTRASNSAFNFILMEASSGNDDKFRVRGDGDVFADGPYDSGGADYAEYFEWSDGNTTTEDRRGISVVLDGDKIREAVAGEEPIGVISANPSVIGDSSWSAWSGKYLRDDFGTYILETHNVVSWEDADGKNHSYEDWNIPADVVVPDDAVISATDENGNAFTHPKLNPDYDPDVEYVPREDRPEWDCVGLMGKLRIRKGQVTGSRWIKMRDISDTVEEWLVR